MSDRSNQRDGAIVAPFLHPAGCPVGVDPAEWRVAIGKRIEDLQDRIQALITALDLIEVDPDLEPYLAGFETPVSDDREGDPGETEPTLGWTLATVQDGRKWLGNADFGDELEADRSDYEPNLGSPEVPAERLVPGGSHGWHFKRGSQEHWAGGRGDDTEEENEHAGDVLDEPHDERDEGNDEPFLGRDESMHQGTGTYATEPDLGPLQFEGGGCLDANDLLRRHGLNTHAHVSGHRVLTPRRGVAMVAMPLPHKASV